MSTGNIYNKHMNLSKRIQIEQFLNEGRSINQISELISKSRNTVYYEIKKHRQLIKCNRYGISKNYDMNCPIKLLSYLLFVILVLPGEAVEKIGSCIMLKMPTVSI